MARECFVLVQKSESSAYNDFVGRFYHFPKKYRPILESPGSEFVYLDSEKSPGKYIGTGRIGKVFSDKREEGHFFVEILDYHNFVKAVPAVTTDGKRWEPPLHFNPQNAVRRLPPDVFDKLVDTGGVYANFRADAHLIRVLGEELISTEAVGVLELVKNSYDAGASFCNVVFEKLSKLSELPASAYRFPTLPGPVIIIEDDGSGMDRQTLLNGWLRPASTIKTIVKDKLKEEQRSALASGRYSQFNALVSTLKKLHRGRLPLGEKGVGRFATHRLGRQLIIRTKTAHSDLEHVLRIDWDDFESKSEMKDLASIDVAISSEAPSRDYGTRNSGTQVVIYGGKQDYELDKRAIEDIATTIKKLRSPSAPTGVFDVNCRCPQLPEIAAKMPEITQSFPPAFSMVASVDEFGTTSDFRLEFTPPQSVPMNPEVIERTIKNPLDIRALDKSGHWVTKAGSELRQTACGAFKVYIDVWYRRAPWIDGPNANEFTRYLDQFGGISVFRDGLNIFPAEWGAETDWLDLSTRHIKKGANLSYYNMIGRIELDQAKNLAIVDKTDRQGMVANLAYQDLEKLTHLLVRYLEITFIGKRDEFSKLDAGIIRDPALLQDAAKQGARILTQLSEKYEDLDDPFGLNAKLATSTVRKAYFTNIADSLGNLNKSMEMIKEVQDLLTEQAGFGISIAVAVHEIAKITSNFYHGVSEMLRSGKLDRKRLEELQETSESLRSELKRFSPLRAIRNEKPGDFAISKSIRFCNALFKQRCEDLGVKFSVEGQGDFPVAARYGAVNQILSNLIDNSCYWLDDKRLSDRRICIHIDPERRTILIGDSGPNIDPSIRPYLFEPGYSLRVPPSGLGLYICKYYMRSMRGNIYEANEKDRIPGLKGAQFILDFSRVPAALEA